MPDGPVGVISQTADLLGFSHETISRVYRELVWGKKRGGMSFSGSGVEEKWLVRRWRSEETTERQWRVRRRMDGFRWECLNFVEEKNENTGPSRLESTVEAFS